MTDKPRIILEGKSIVEYFEQAVENKKLKDKLYAKEQEYEKLKEWKKEHLKDVEFIERNPVIDILNSMADNILLEQRNEKLKQTLTEIKELLLKTPTDSQMHCVNAKSVILQKISEVEDG